jgi:hypothetical protein
MIPPEPNDALSRALAAWRVQPPANPNFRPAVWQRVHEESRQTWSAYVRRHVASWSIGALAAVTVAGWAGHAIARARLESGREQMVVTYLGGLDPRVLAKLRP